MVYAQIILARFFLCDTRLQLELALILLEGKKKITRPHEQPYKKLTTTFLLGSGTMPTVNLHAILYLNLQKPEQNPINAISIIKYYIINGAVVRVKNKNKINSIVTSADKKIHIRCSLTVDGHRDGAEE